MTGGYRARTWISGITVAGVLLLVGCTSHTSPTRPASPDSSPPPGASATAPTSAEPPGGVDWASFPPNHLDTARDLSDPQFPADVSSFALDSVSTGSVSTTASYVDVSNYRSIGVTVVFGLHQYSVVIDGLRDVAYSGQAVCGVSQRSEQSVCLMVGVQQLLEVRGGTGVPLEEAASFVENIYTLL